MNLKLTHIYRQTLKTTGLAILAVFMIMSCTFQKNTWAETTTSDYTFIELSHQMAPANEFSSSTDNIFQVQLYNRGEVSLRDVTVALTLPKGLSFGNSSNVESVGTMVVGERKKLAFPIKVDSDAESKSFPITVEVTGVGYRGEPYQASRIFYVLVKGVDSFLDENIEITDIKMPTSVWSEDSFTVSFGIKNNGSSSPQKLKVNVDAGEGLVNKTKNIFTDTNFPNGSQKKYSVVFYAPKTDVEKSSLIKITVTASATATSEEKEEGISQYGTVFISPSTAKGKEKKPQLIVDHYDFNGSSVQAGSKFYLNFNLYNTSRSKLSNIKGSIVSENGVLLPIDGSNSFYLDEISAKSTLSKSIQLGSSSQAEHKTVALTMNLSYEDDAGNAYEAAEIISIPITQTTQLICDQPVVSGEIYVGQQSSCEVQFYNVGKNTLHNLMVESTGNFDTAESNRYYVGNMESGKSDSYSFTFIPKSVGEMKGKVAFTYEDANGSVQSQSVSFSFSAIEMPPFEEEIGGLPEEPNMSIGKKLIVAGLITSLATLTIFCIRRSRKKKMNELLELAEPDD